MQEPNLDDYDYCIPGDIERYCAEYHAWWVWHRRYRRARLRACKPWYFQKGKRYRWYDTYTWHLEGIVQPGKDWPVIVFFRWIWM